MYIKKSILNTAVVFLGAVILTVLALLFCFTEINIPAGGYFAAWALCLGAMSACVSGISRSR